MSAPYSVREQAALRIDPWGDGKGDDQHTVFRNDIVITRKPATCSLCFESIPVRSRVRAQTEQSDGKVMTFRFCPACVDAMAEYGIADDIEPLEQRYSLGRSHTKKEPA